LLCQFKESHIDRNVLTTRRLSLLISNLLPSGIVNADDSFIVQWCNQKNNRHTKGDTMQIHARRALALCAMTLATGPSVLGGAVVGGFDSHEMWRNDDQSTGQIAVGFDLNFFGATYNSVYINNNGNVTFDGPLWTYTPFNLLSTSTKIIAPFFGDVDTRNTASDVTSWGWGTFGGRDAFGVTWDGVHGVGYYYYGVDKLNKFQLLVVDRSDVGAGDFDIYFNYDQIQWETGDASGGSGGLGGYSARAGYSNGTDAAYELPGSAINGAFLDGGPNALAEHSNLEQFLAGRYLFEVRNGEVEPPEPPRPGVPDGGSTAGMVGLAILGVVGLARRKC
jgi:hypothetical protein